MATELEVRERQKNHLQVLLTIKKLNAGTEVKGLDYALEQAITPMTQEDIAWVEKIANVKAIG